MISKRFIKAREKTPMYVKLFVSKNLKLLERIFDLLEKHEMTYDELSNKLNIPKNEITVMLSGTYNFDLKTLTKLEYIFGEEIINISN